MKAAFLVALVPALVSAQDVQLPLSGDRCANAIALDAPSALSVLQPAEVLDAWQDMGVMDLLKEVGDDCGLEEERLVEVFGEGEARWMTEGDKLRLRAEGFDFMDITDHQDLGSIRRALPPTQLPSALPEISVDALGEIVRLTDDLTDYTQMQDDLANLTSFWTRSYRSLWGARSSDWLYGYVGDIVKAADPSVNITIRRFTHSFPQKSLVVRLESAADDAHYAEDPRLIIIGAHQDSLNYKLPFYRAPGADDDGSGTVALLQILRTLVGKSFTPPAGIAVELHWYAAEEGGLLGSQDVAAEYERKGKEVIGMLQMDGLAVVKHGVEPKIGLFQDEVDKGLLDYVTGLVDAYLPVPWARTGCGKRCGSDHMSWTRAGYRAAYVCEGLFEEMGEGYHTVNDTVNLIEGEYSFEHLQRFVKLGISFIVELSASSASLA
ncbi:Zn-dependent exopeptidase [Schizophyllum commune Tattone D]|nr:Zn-dependent exopeptidase [Schizophyllum commune Tattone D]